MAAIVEEITVEATPQRVYDALTRQDEIVRWWASEARVKPEVGSLGTFHFRPSAGVLKFEVAELKQGEKVCWISRQAPPSWSGTTVTWELTPLHNATRVIFTHAGFARIDEAIERVRENWAFFLSSLKSYLETGKGIPGTPPNLK